MMETSSFSDIQQIFPDAERLTVNSSTADCYRVRLYGKLHFLKRLKPELRDDPRYQAAMHKEFEVGYNLDHPHLVRYLSHGDDYLTTEYVDGETLGKFISTNPDYFRSQKNTRRFLSQLLDVVGYLHQNQIVHLDLKPDNILITRIGHNVKLMDLGYSYTDSFTDTTGRTDKYAAPEQLQGKPVDVRTDIYAIGRILQSLPCAGSYKNIIKHCIAQDPDKRFQTIDEIRRRIQTAAPVRRILLYAGIAFLLVLLAFLIWPRPQGSSVITSPTLDVSSHDSVASSPAMVVKEHETSATNDVKATPVPEVVGSNIVKTNADQLPRASQTAVAPMKTLSMEEMDKRISNVITPIFQRIKGSLRDSTWNRNTEKMYSDLSLKVMEQGGNEIRVLWNDLSKHYDIDERTFYRQYGKVRIALENELYDRMRRNTK